MMSWIVSTLVGVFVGSVLGVGLGLLTIHMIERREKQ